MRKIDCLIVRQPYASLIAYGSKRWEFRNYSCEKRGIICIGSSRSNPLKTGDPFLNSISSSFPRGSVLAFGILVDSFLATSKHLKEAFRGEETLAIHGFRVTTASKPLGEPVADILDAIRDKNWKMYAWIFRDVIPLKTIVPLENNNGGSTWTKVELSQEESPSKSIESYL